MDDGDGPRTGSEDENFVPVEESAGAAPEDRSADHQHQQHQQQQSTKKPPSTVRGGNGRHHDNTKQRHGAKGSGSRFAARRWPHALTVAAVFAWSSSPRSLR